MKAKVRMVSFIAWITTIVLFLIGIFSFQFFKDSSHWYQVLTTVWLGDIGVGIIAFLVMLVASANSGDVLAHTPANVERAIRKPTGAKILIVTLLILLALLGSGVAVADYMETKKELNNLKEAQLNPTPVPVTPIYTPTSPPQRTFTNTQNSGSGNKIDCVGPDGKHMSVTQIECDNFNNAWKNPQDQIVSCRMQTACGGQVLQITKKECDTVICCEVDGKWSTYPNKDTCTNAQNRSSGSNTSTYKDTTAYWDCVGRAQSAKNSYVTSFCITGDDRFYTCSALAESQYQSALKICDSLK